MSPEDLDGVAAIMTRLSTQDASYRLSDPVDGLRRVDRELLVRTLGVELLVPLRWRNETLGLVLYRKGALHQARRELQEAIRLYPQPSASALFSLAMTCRRLGLPGEARSAYERAVSRQRATSPKDPRLIRAELEASHLLGVQVR